MFNWLRGFLASLVAEIHNVIATMASAILGLLMEALVGVTQFFVDLMPGTDSIDISAALDMIYNSPHYDFVMYLIPFRECFAIWLVAVGIAATIRTLRFAIGWIPTIEG